MADESTTEETTSEETTSTEETTASSEETTESNESTDETKVDSDDDWETKARKRGITIKTERAKREAAETKVKEFEDAKKSESEKLTDRVTTTEQALAEAKADAAKLRVAIKYDLSEEDLDFLGSGDEDQIEERAKRLSERLNAKKDDEETEESAEGSKPPKSRPTEKTKRTGATSVKEPEEMDPDKLAEAVPSTGF